MSWQERLQNKLQITTGDGRVYEPLHMVQTNTASFEFNIAEFEFPEIPGTKVDRRLHKGTRYPMEFYFQGDDCVEQGQRFVESSRDTRPWKVVHPIFGSFIGHPLAIEMDASGINTFKVSCTVVETILDDGPKTVFDPAENAPAIITKSREANTSSFANSVTTLEPSDTVLLQDNIDKLYESSKNSISDQGIADKYFNLYNTATTFINEALSDVRIGIDGIQAFITYPAQFLLDVKQRILLLVDNAAALANSFENLTTFKEKKIWENNKGALISAMVETVSAPQDGDYTNATDVIFVIDQLLTFYNDYIGELQQLQSPNGFELGAYLPDAQFLESLSYSVNYAVSNLFTIALTAQQERAIFLESDSNVIVQAHRFYGTQQDDSGLKRFIETNKIGLNETLQLKKGRRLVYYV